MRQFGEGFAAHIASGATTLCWCWRIVRTDGVRRGAHRDETVVSASRPDDDR